MLAARPGAVAPVGGTGAGLRPCVARPPVGASHARSAVSQSHQTRVGGRRQVAAAAGGGSGGGGTVALRQDAYEALQVGLTT